MKSKCPYRHHIGYACELVEDHAGDHIATDLDEKSRVGWRQDDEQSYKIIKVSWSGDGPRTEIADTIAGAEILEVASDSCEERSTTKVMRITAKAAGDAYAEAAAMLIAGGHHQNAREICHKAAACYERAGEASLTNTYRIRANREWLRTNGNIYE